MGTRQIIGKRRNISAMQSRGVARREALIQAAIKLLETQDPQEISFKEIARIADVPEGSAYHFYANKYDLFAAVAEEMSQLFQAAQSVPVDESSTDTWHDLVRTLVDRGAAVYRQNPVARKLLIGSTTPPEIKQLDRENDRRIAEIMRDRFADLFEIPLIANFEQKLFYFIEITDVLFGLEYRDKGEISDAIINEAKLAAIGYLSNYLPPVLERRERGT